jgi:hypothetical protein
MRATSQPIIDVEFVRANEDASINAGRNICRAVILADILDGGENCRPTIVLSLPVNA